MGLDRSPPQVVPHAAGPPHIFNVEGAATRGRGDYPSPAQTEVPLWPGHVLGHGRYVPQGLLFFERVYVS